MDTQSSIALGTTTNLLYGYRPVPIGSDPADSPLFAPAKQMLETFAPTFDAVPAPWSDPNLSFHPNAASLLSTLFDYQVIAPGDEESAPVIPSGPLIAGDKDSASVLKTLSTTVGVDLQNSSLSYVLVRLVRPAGSAIHPNLMNNVFTGRFPRSGAMKEMYRLAMLRRLQTGLIQTERRMTGRFSVGGTFPLDPSHDDIGGYFSFFETYGTHFVSKIEFGDVIYQVFAYSSTAFAKITAAYPAGSPNTSGPTAIGFEYWTSPSTTSGLGFVAPGGCGKILSISGDTALAQSVAAGNWHDPLYAQTDSIFQAFAPEFSVDLDTSFTQVTGTAFELTSLSQFADPLPRQIWRRVLKAAMYQKYGDGIEANFGHLPAYDYNAIFPASATGFVSTIATPTIDVYQPRMDLSNLQLVAPEVVTGFSVFTNVLQISDASVTSPIVIPGESVALVSHVFDMGTAAGNVAVVQLSDAAYDSCQIACQEFVGPLALVNASGTKRNVIVDGERYQLVDSATYPQRYNVAPDGDVRRAPAPSLVPLLAADIEYSLTQAQVLLGMRSTAGTAAAQGRVLILKYLNWIAFAIPETTEDATLLELRVRAFYLARVAAKIGFSGVHVPFLTYETYQPLVGSILNVVTSANQSIFNYQQQIQARKQEELTIKVGSELNENIIESGKLLSGFIGASADQQSDLAGFYGQIIAEKQKSLASAQARVGTLLGLLHEQQQAVQTAVTKYQDAVTRWENEQIYNFVMGLAQNIFSVGFSVAVPSTEISSVKSLGETAQKVQKAVTVFTNLNTMYKTLQQGITNLQQAQNALASIGYDGAEFPSSLEWSEFSVNFNAALTNGPPVPEKTDLQAAFNIMVLRGQALLTAQATIQQIAGEIYMNQRQQQLSTAQQQRLAALNGFLGVPVGELDPSKIDLLGLTSSLQLLVHQMLAMLATTLALQDEALQYQYLQPPTQIPSFDLLSLQQVMLRQQQSIIAGLSVQPPPEPLPGPLTYTVTISVADLANGNAVPFTIPLSATQFFDYAMVRVSRVVASMKGVASTKSGNFEIDLLFNGKPFQDRDADRNPLTFNTIARELNYLYDAATGEAKFGGETGTSPSNVSEITPFGTWQISLPANQANAGIAFTGPTVAVTLSFTITALLREPSQRGLDVRRSLIEDRAATLPPQPPTPQVISSMYGATVLNGWDAVFTLSESKVNDVLKAQYDARTGNPAYFFNIPQQTVTSKPDPGTHNADQIIFSLELGAVAVEFLGGDTCTVTLPIVSGTFGHNLVLQNGTIIPITNVGLIDVSTKPQVVGNVPLKKIQGSAAGPGGGATWDVVLDFTGGSFIGANIVNDDPVTAALLNAIITGYLATHDIKYLINTLDFSNYATLAALTPQQFTFKTGTTASNINILQIFIVTTGAPPADLGINLADPLPSGSDCSLFINTSILFGSIFTKSFEASANISAMKAVAPSDTTKSYSAQVQTGQIVAPFPSQADVRVDSNSVTLNLAGMSFTPSQTGVLNASYNSTFSQGFQVYQCTSGMYGSGTCSWNDASLDVTITIDFPMPIKVTGSGTNQGIVIDSSPVGPSVNGSLDSSGPCKCNDRQAQEEFLAQAQAVLPGEVQSAVNMAFDTVSLFALKNLLFPAGNIINFTIAAAPGDLAIFGTMAP